LILASASPRRQEALRALGQPHEIVISDAEERLGPQSDPTDPRPAAHAKAEDVLTRHPDALVLAGDTIVAGDGEALGKPLRPDRAAGMLKRLRGAPHTVNSAVVVRGGGTSEAGLVIAPLTMRRYSDQEIAEYVATGEPLDCAGAYDIHRRGGALIESVEGCFSAIVGLPIAEACRLLAHAGIAPQEEPAVVCSALYGRRCLAADPLTRPRCLPE
jgi:nucleoside triphosphate pyrophosphatase